jgi:hypothetical protein
MYYNKYSFFRALFEVDASCLLGDRKTPVVVAVMVQRAVESAWLEYCRFSKYLLKKWYSILVDLTMEKTTVLVRQRSHMQNLMPSPSKRHDDSNMMGSTKTENLFSAQDASASATPVKRVSFPDKINLGIKKAVSDRGNRKQNFRNNRVCDSTWLHIAINLLFLIIQHSHDISNLLVTTTLLGCSTHHHESSGNHEVDAQHQ